MIEGMDLGPKRENGDLFSTFESTLPQKYMISPLKILYEITCYNKLAEEFIGHSKPQLQDIQNKFRSVSIPREKGSFL